MSLSGFGSGTALAPPLATHTWSGAAPKAQAAKCSESTGRCGCKLLQENSGASSVLAP